MTSSSTVTIQSVALGRRVENRYLVLLLLEDLREHVVSRGQLLPGRVALPERLVAFASKRRGFRTRGTCCGSQAPSLQQYISKRDRRARLAPDVASAPKTGRLLGRKVPMYHPT